MNKLENTIDEIERKDSFSSTKTTAEQEIVNQYVIKLTDELRSALQAQGTGEFRPELIIGRSEILDFDDVVNIGKNLSEKCSWFLNYSTLLNDKSLETLYSKTASIVGPTLLLIKDTEKRVFGALLSDAPRLSNGYYGTGQSFLFECKPTFKVHRWTGKDHCFVNCGLDSLCIGRKDEKGHCALELKGPNLTTGVTYECETYGNPPLVPDSNVFTIKIVECWHFGLASDSP